MVLQFALQLYGYYEDDVYKQYGVYDAEVHSAALKMSGLLTERYDGLQFAPSLNAFNVLFSSTLADKRTEFFIQMIQMFRVQHRTVQEFCRGKLRETGAIAEIEVTIEQGSLTGGNGRADLMAKGVGGSYIWEVKHDSQGGVALGRKQLTRYVTQANSNLKQEIMEDKGFEKPVLMGQQLFNNIAIPFDKGYIKLRHDVPSGLIMYDKVNTLPDGYEKVPKWVEKNEWESQKTVDFVGTYAIDTSYGTAIANGLSFDPSTGQIVLGVVITVAAGVTLIVLVYAGVSAIAALPAFLLAF